MKSVDSIARVRRAFHVEVWSLKRISRELHVSRNTVRRILRSNETSFFYEREHQPKPGTSLCHVQLDGNLAKPQRERLTPIRIYEELCALGFLHEASLARIAVTNGVGIGYFTEADVVGDLAHGRRLASGVKQPEDACQWSREAERCERQRGLAVKVSCQVEKRLSDRRGGLLMQRSYAVII